MKNFALILVAFAYLAGAVQADTIVLRNKPPVSGVTVVTENIKEVVYTDTAGKGRTTLDAADVLAVIYDKPPKAYRLGVEKLNLGEFQNAVQHLTTALTQSADARPWLKEYAGINLARSHFALGQFSEAAAAYEKVLFTDRQDSRWINGAAAGLVLAHAMGGKISEAEGALRRLKAAGLSGAWEKRAEMALVEGLIGAGKYDQAADKAGSTGAGLAKNENPFLNEIYYSSRGSIIEANIAAGNLPKAKNTLNDLKIKVSGGGSPAMAVSRISSAAITIAESKDSEELLKAAFNLARVRAENYDVASQMARTCYLLGLVHLKLDGTLAKARELAKDYFEETRRRFPESRQAFLARDQLKGM